MGKVKLSSAMRRMLLSARDNGNLYAGLHGRSQMGGAVWTVKALIKRGYINNDWHVTDAGIAALKDSPHGQ